MPILGKALLLEAFHRALVTDLDGVGVKPKLLPRAALTQEIPVAVELHPDLLQPPVFIRGKTGPVRVDTKQPVLLCHQRLYLALHRRVIHPPSIREPGLPSYARTGAVEPAARGWGNATSLGVDPAGATSDKVP